MPSKPILVFPSPTTTARTVGEPNPPAGPTATPAEQGAKLQDRWRKVEDDVHLSLSMAGSISEMVLVLEVKTSIESFYSAVKETEELQFIGEEFDFMPDAEVAVDPESDPYYPTDSRIFLTLQNEASLYKLLSLWNRYLNGQEFDRGLGRYQLLFQLLEDVRLYSVQDRLRDTGYIQYLSEVQSLGLTSARTEIELQFRTKKHKPAPVFNPKTGKTTHPLGKEEFDEARTLLVYESLKEIIENAGGRIIEGSRVVIPSIRYHAVAADIPLELFEDISNNTETDLLQATQILHFRPLGQTSWIGALDEESGPSTEAQDFRNSDELPTGNPIAALLDGLPLQNHVVLRGRLTIDADGIDEARYPAAGRFHGTAMSSIITRGDLSDALAAPLKHPLYVRPIMVSVSRPDGTIAEEFPAAKLPIDVIHQAVERLFLPNEAGVTSDIRIVNLSIGDSYRPFLHTMSAWARLIDWLSYKHNVLFIISAGNVLDSINLKLPETTFNTLTSSLKEQSILDHIVTDNLNRKILTPSESINAITVGSSQGDASQGPFAAHRLMLIEDSTLASPLSRIGFGYRASIKPEVLMPGGRKCYTKPVLQASPSTHTSIVIEEIPYSFSPPGVKVAIPTRPGATDTVAYQWGTSNAAALATRLACQIHEMLDEMNASGSPEEYIDRKYFTVLIKALLVHGAKWGDSHETLAQIVGSKFGVSSNYVKKHITPYLGYGVVRGHRVISCTDNRVTLLGWGELKKEKAHEYTFPLPLAIEAAAIEKTITITLAWLSPTNWQTRRYRQARLYFENITGDGRRFDSEELDVKREGADYYTARRGTVQHDVLSGNSAELYNRGGNLVIKINCLEDAMGLSTSENVPYGIAVTFEVDDNAGIPIYDEVKQRLTAGRIRPR